MRRRIVSAALVTVAALTSVLAVGAPAHASPTLQIVYSQLPYDTCIAFGRAGQETGRWGVWWCSQHYPQTYPGYVTYDMWAYVE
ncbi:hypothetical protein MF672_032940 [Actinomadura sp. ATCC 31491]|uniref:Secreted protein n=1 Tax=Actinomadura luzonensis TaxID=2805427 RepID=A0ABT0G1T7_9ACTN|nr:hypothetical protein [Actinomadura luzonensis]MCK2218567.1 hypothetical protein [Actinomadura luzonensis]